MSLVYDHQKKKKKISQKSYDNTQNYIVFINVGLHPLTPVSVAD